MVLQNARDLGNNPAFLQDAFTTFAHSTDKMISLIANLSLQKGQLVSDHQPIDIVKLLRSTFDDLKIDQRKGVRLITEFPSKSPVAAVAGDPSQLQKAFANILLNAVQSLPNGEGTIQVAVYQPDSKVVTAFTDTGYGMSPETLRNLFRPFHTTKKGGLGIGLCHTRTIVEGHGGRIRIDSAINKGTKVEIELPARL
jgi:signal transduction histidine kinase